MTAHELPPSLAQAWSPPPSPQSSAAHQHASRQHQSNQAPSKMPPASRACFHGGQSSVIEEACRRSPPPAKGHSQRNRQARRPDVPKHKRRKDKSPNGNSDEKSLPSRPKEPEEEPYWPCPSPPLTPRDTRLPTPDLPPLAGGDHFCPCDAFSRTGGKARRDRCDNAQRKMEAQLAFAQQYMNAKQLGHYLQGGLDDLGQSSPAL